VDVLDEKLRNATTLGATHTVNAAKEDAVERIKVYMSCQLDRQSLNSMYLLHHKIHMCLFFRSESSLLFTGDHWR
jgi:Zn-dependent alcohol dehydrogenase